MDAALDGVRWVLANNADLFPVLPGCNSLRVVRTDEFARTGGLSPALRVYFRILSDDLVELAWVEEV